MWMLFLILGTIVSLTLVICYCALVVASHEDDMSEDYFNDQRISDYLGNDDEEKCGLWAYKWGICDHCLCPGDCNQCDHRP